MRDKKRALIFPETLEDAEELMKEDGTLFPGCYRRNIRLEKLALVFVNISQRDANNYEISHLFNILNITSCASISKNEEAKIIKVFFKTTKDKLNVLSNNYRNGINVSINGEDINIKVEPCIKAIPQCNRCNKLQHREDKCRERYSHCAYCNGIDHPDSDCSSNVLYCTNCGGNHNAYNYRECEKYKSLKKLELKRETEFQLGLTSGSLSKKEGVSYAGSFLS